MNGDLVGHPRLERMLAAVLRYGTWLASGVIALGLLLTSLRWPAEPAHLSSTNVVVTGIALLILLPVFRVSLMLLTFLIERDYRFAAISALVLAIIGLGFLAGVKVS